MRTPLVTMTALITLLCVGLATVQASARAGTPAHGSPRAGSAVQIGTARVSGLGTVLVRGNGRPLYVFQATTAAEPGCAACHKIWFPVLAPASGHARAVGGARQSLIGSVEDPVIRRRVLTYNGWPLYTYVLDKLPDIADGQGILMGGGYWRVLTAAGKVDTKTVSHGGGYVGS
jgi:predicted lipoprotein with Yx(FWY)xxD motif